MNNIEKLNDIIFENIKHIDEKGNEYWLARELMKALEYTEYRKFLPVIDKAIISCINSDQNLEDHIAHVGGMINTGKGARRKVEDYKLSRYACYLIAQNGDSRKKVIALAQTYFAYQINNERRNKHE